MVKNKPHTADIIVGRNIRVYRLRKNLSQTELADKLGITFQQVQKYEKGTNRVGAGRLLDISLILEVPFVALFEGIKTHDFEGTKIHGSPLSDFLTNADGLALLRAFSFSTRAGRRVIASPAKSKTDVTAWSAAFDNK